VRRRNSRRATPPRTAGPAAPYAEAGHGQNPSPADRLPRPPPVPLRRVHARPEPERDCRLMPRSPLPRRAAGNALAAAQATARGRASTRGQRPSPSAQHAACACRRNAARRGAAPWAGAGRSTPGPPAAGRPPLHHRPPPATPGRTWSGTLPRRDRSPPDPTPPPPAGHTPGAPTPGSPQARGGRPARRPRVGGHPLAVVAPSPPAGTRSEL